MVYQSQFVAVVKANGKILREDKDSVYIPFGQEYSIMVKNLASRKALVKISIDGQDVLNGNSLIVGPNSTSEIERFLERLDSGNKFKFIEKTAKISEHRGDKIDDGIIRIEYQFEKPRPQYPIYRSAGPCRSFSSSNSGDSLKWSSDTTCLNSFSTQAVPTASPAAVSEDGITVKGSESNQAFTYGSIGALETESHVITLKLRGIKETGTVVAEPLTVKTKLVCKTCGTSHKSNVKYCSECGTFLE